MHEGSRWVTEGMNQIETETESKVIGATWEYKLELDVVPYPFPERRSTRVHVMTELDEA